MQTIQIVFEAELLREADLAAKKHHVNRSALIRDAVRDHLKRLRLLDLEEEECLAYQRIPASRDDEVAIAEFAAWAEEHSE